MLEIASPATLGLTWNEGLSLNGPNKLSPYTQIEGLNNGVLVINGGLLTTMEGGMLTTEPYNGAPLSDVPSNSVDPDPDPSA